MSQPFKSMAMAYLLWLVLGGFGGHRFYLGRLPSAFGMWVPFVGAVAIALMARNGAETLPEQTQQIMVYGMIGLLAAWGLWVVADAFLIPGMVRRANAALMHAEDDDHSLYEEQSLHVDQAVADFGLDAHYVPPKPGRDYAVQRTELVNQGYKSPGQKEIWVAYLLWFLLGGLGIHRFYVKRGTSGLIMLGLYVGGFVVALTGVMQSSQSSMILGAMMVCAVITWLLIDLFTIPSMVESCNTTDDGLGPYMPGPSSLDPGFGATMAKAGANPNKRRKKALPEGYVMPWRQDRSDEQEIYSPGRDE